MKSVLLVVILAVIATAYAIPVNIEDKALAVRESREVDVLGTYRTLIENLVRDLRGAAKDAADAFKSFGDGLTNLARQYGEKIAKDIQDLRDRVASAIKSLSGRFSKSGSVVRNCIESRSAEATTIFNDTVANTMACSNQRIKEVTSMLTNLNTISSSASELATVAMNNMSVCTQGADAGFLASTSCMGKVALQTEMKATAFITQTGLEIARVNMALATLPAALDVCAGSRLVEAGLSTARVVMDIGSCSASDIFSIFKNTL